MKRSNSGHAVYAEIGVWRERDGSIHLTLKGVKNGHVAVNADPTKRNGHPTLFARLDALLKSAPEPRVLQVQLVSPDGTVTEGPKFEIQSGRSTKRGRGRL
jgi:hypothetical protein